MAEEEEKIETKPLSDEAQSGAESGAQSGAESGAPNVEDPVDVWTHPEHKVVCIAATLFKNTSAFLTLVVWMMNKPWLDQKDETYAFDEAVCDANGYCMLKDDAKASGIEDNGFTDTVGMVISIAVGCEIIGDFFLNMFWLYYAAAGRVKNIALKLLIFAIAVTSYIKFVGAFMLIGDHAKINKTYSWGTHEDDRMYTDKYPKLLKLQTLHASLLCFAFVLEMISMCFLLVTIDKGLPGMSHHKRLLIEEEARIRQESMDFKLLATRKSYAPDNASENKILLTKIASTMSQKNVQSSISTA